ncbi:MAG: homoserine dehydrogenase [Blautia sp.]
MSKKVIKAALLGLGTVGTGVYTVLKNQEEEMEQKIGASVAVKKILVRNLKKAAAKIPEPELLTNSWQEILEDESIEIVIEVMGGIHPAKEYITQALCAGKHVVTANKDLVASFGGELLDCAAEHHCDFLFEASVAGGIPIIRPLKQCLAGNHISEVVGIVNGTTNFILTKMTQEHMEFADALALATRLGYAEADPTADIQGYDAGRKVAIMASIAFNSRVTFEDVATEGITHISSKDIRYAKELGCVIKLLGVAKNTGDGIEVKVQPMLVPEGHPLASVNDSFNAVFVHGDAVDDAMFYGRGAGELPTASAIVGDVFDIVRNILFGCTGRISCTCYKALSIKKQEETESRFFLRLHVDDKPGVLAGIASVLGNYRVSIAQMIQKHREEDFAEIVVVTSKVREGNFHDAMLIIEGMEAVHKITSVIRVYGEQE